MVQLIIQNEAYEGEGNNWIIVELQGSLEAEMGQWQNVPLGILQRESQNSNVSFHLNKQFLPNGFRPIV